MNRANLNLESKITRKNSQEVAPSLNNKNRLVEKETKKKRKRRSISPSEGVPPVKKRCGLGKNERMSLVRRNEGKRHQLNQEIIELTEEAPGFLVEEECGHMEEDKIRIIFTKQEEDRMESERSTRLEGTKIIRDAMLDCWKKDFSRANTTEEYEFINKKLHYFVVYGGKNETLMRELQEKFINALEENKSEKIKEYTEKVIKIIANRGRSHSVSPYIAQFVRLERPESIENLGKLMQSSMNNEPNIVWKNNSFIAEKSENKESSSELLKYLNQNSKINEEGKQKINKLQEDLDQQYESKRINKGQYEEEKQCIILEGSLINAKLRVKQIESDYKNKRIEDRVYKKAKELRELDIKYVNLKLKLIELRQQLFSSKINIEEYRNMRSPTESQLAKIWSKAVDIWKNS